MIRNDNPAQKLLNILEELKLRSNQNCWLAWKEVLDIEREDDFPAAFGKILSLISEITQYLEVYEPDAVEDCKHLKVQIFSGIYNNRFGSNMSSFIDCIDEHVLKDLRNFSRLMKNFDCKKLEQKELDEIYQKMQDLQNTILDSTHISNELRLSLNKYISKILHLVGQYKISSSEEILLNIEALTGHLILSEEGRNLLQDRSPDSLGVKLSKTISDIASICTILQFGNPQIGVGIINLLSNTVSL